ncbi:MAG: FmdB family zinc ribbon protein [Actinomycetes bacterium]
MPTYQYACNACGHEFELVQSFSEDAIRICPECQGEVRKVYSNVGVVFKGSGFYKTDSRTSSPSTPKVETAKPATTPAPASE